MTEEAPATSCDRPGCGGRIDTTGFCELCGRRNTRSAVGRVAPSTSTSAAQPPTEPSPDLRRWWAESAQRWSVAGLVNLPILELPDPRSRLIVGSTTRTSRRICGVNGCQSEVGGGYAGQPALAEGFCPECGEPFSFLPRLRPDEVVGGQYQIVGCLAHGGLGWVYLARDQNLGGNFVALKGLINANDPVSAELATRERQFLTELAHPNIVRIFNAVTHYDERLGRHTGYIVMEYVNGPSLSQVQTAALRHQTTLRLEEILAFGHEILAAMAYLHDEGLLYCDMKPENVILGRREVKVIDLGAVRRIDDRESPVTGTKGYQVSTKEIKERGLTVRSDLHTVGRTLERMFLASADRLPTRENEPIAVAVTSFRHLVERASHPNHHRRFATATEMSEQLTGVLREVVATREKAARTEQSTVFAASAELIDGELSTVPPLERWTVTGDDEAASMAQPPPDRLVASRLPVPYPVAEDPATGFLRQVRAPDPRSLIEKINAEFPDQIADPPDRDPASVEAALWRCRAFLELGDADSATGWLQRAAGPLGLTTPRDWRIAWHHGLVELAGGRARAARTAFDNVYRALPGEIAPKLALGLCAERLGERDEAERHLSAAWLRDHLQASAAFGLARIALARGRRREAVELLDEVPAISRHFDAARVGAVRALSERLSGGPPTGAELREAAERLPHVHLDGGDPDGDARQRLTALVRHAALDAVRRGATPAVPPGNVVLGAATEQGLRLLLERSLRALARQARTADDHGVLVDLANAVRPRTLLTGWRA